MFAIAAAGCASQKEAMPTAAEPISAEEYTDYGHRDDTRTAVDPRSTFAADVDTASYALARRKLFAGALPPPASVRVEEFVNYFPYDYPQPQRGPLAVHFEAAPSPFNTAKLLVRVGLQGRKVAFDQRKPAHLTMLLDTSGSTAADGKLDLAKHSIRLLLDELGDGDTVSLVAYGGSAGLVLGPTPLSRRSEVLDALDRLTSGGNSALADGLSLAYLQAESTFEQGQINRVMLYSDGDANVGPATHSELSKIIADRAGRGIALTALGFGPASYSDTTLERLADGGDGNYFFIDNEREARRVVVDELVGTLQIIAADVKVQVLWSGERVLSHRLIGYENREIADHAFRDDGANGGALGAGHQVTALYEVELVDGALGDLATVLVRSRIPENDTPEETVFSLRSDDVKPSTSEGSRSYRMALAAAWFAEVLRRSPHAEDVDIADVLALARGAARDEYAEDAELVALIEVAASLM